MIRALRTARRQARGALDALLRTRRVRNAVFRTLAEDGRRVFADLGDHAFVFDPSEFIGRTLYETGAFQRETIEAVIARALGPGREGGVFLEIGANIGTQTVYANLAHRFARTVAVEPDPANFALLAANLRLNGLGDRAVACPVAISDREAVLTLRPNRLHSGMSTLEPPLPGVEPPRGREAIAVRALTADRLVAEQGVAPGEIALVWMDVEGHEPKALAGMTAILEAAPPLFFEYSPGRMSGAEMDWIETAVLGRYGRLFEHRDGGGLAEIGRAELARLRGTDGKIDILALP